MRDFKYSPLATTDERKVALDIESPAFVFETGKSYFAAYRLPAWNGPYQIRAEAKSGANVRAGTFGPSVLMLDADYRIARQFNTGQGSGPRPDVVHVFVNESNKDEQYLVLFTAKLSTTEGVDALVAAPRATMIGSAYVVLGASESRVSLQYSPTGVLQLKVSPYQPVKAGQSARVD